MAHFRRERAGKLYRIHWWVLRDPPVGHPRSAVVVQLSLSVRIAEAFGAKDRALMPFEELAQIAANVGYDALCIRASQAGIDTSLERRLEMVSLLDDLGLGVTMVTGDESTAANDDDASAPLRNIRPHLDLAQQFRSPLVRVMIKTDSDIEFARSAAAEAAARGLRLAHQMHVGTLLETIDEATAIVERVGLEGFGITLEPANMIACGEDCGPDAIARLAPFLVNVYLQNQVVDEYGPTAIRRRDSIVRVRNIPLDADEGIDFNAIFEALRTSGYDGPVTVHQSAIEGLPIEDSARRYYELLSNYMRY